MFYEAIHDFNLTLIHLPLCVSVLLYFYVCEDCMIHFFRGLVVG